MLFVLNNTSSTCEDTGLCVQKSIKDKDVYEASIFLTACDERRPLGRIHTSKKAGDFRKRTKRWEYLDRCQLTAFLPCIRHELHVLHSMHCHLRAFTLAVRSVENFRQEGWPVRTRSGLSNCCSPQHSKDACNQTHLASKNLP